MLNLSTTKWLALLPWCNPILPLLAEAFSQIDAAWKGGERASCRRLQRPACSRQQLLYKYGDTLQDTITKLEYDLYYIKNMSMALDTYIIFDTLKVLLLSRGAQ